MRAILAVAGFIIALACADGAAAQPAPEKLALARRYAVAMHAERQMRTMMETMMPLMMKQMAQQRGLTITPEVTAAFTKAAGDSVVTMTPKMLDIMTPLIAETFSDNELRAIVAFYESDVGQAVVNKTPEFTAKSAPAMARLMPEFQAEMMSRLLTELQKAAPPKPLPSSAPSF